MNALKVDIACIGRSYIMNHAKDTGNHDFDFGKIAHPDNANDRLPPLDTFAECDQIPLAPLQYHRHQYRSPTREIPQVLDNRKMRRQDWSHWLSRTVGHHMCTTLMRRDWIATIPSWPESFTYRSMIDTAKELSQELRDPKGEHQVDIIIALTHCRVPNVSLISYDIQS